MLVLIWLLWIAIGSSVVYWAVRLAVRDALEDVERRRRKRDGFGPA